MRYFLLGFMGSGKTTLGISLAARMGMPFVDLDALIQSREGCSISEIFAEVGENGFRMIERAHLHTLQKYRKVVVATGGGTPCFYDNMLWMNHFGVTLYLQTSPEVLFNRLLPQVAKRPLLARLSSDELLPFIQDTIREREKFYKTAHLTAQSGPDERNLLQTIEKMLRGFSKKRRAKPAV